jgi:hypothetical protein
MSGNLNILPHKSWNVYNKKNRDKVAQDEAEYADELRRETERLSLVNAELRRTKLLARRNVTSTASNSSTQPVDQAPVDARVTLTDACRERPPMPIAAAAANRSQLLDRPNYLSDVNNVPTPFYLQTDRGTDVPDEATLLARADEASRQAQSLRTPAHIAANVIQESQAQLSRLQRLQAERDTADPMAALLVKRQRPATNVDSKTNEDDNDNDSSSSSSDSSRSEHRKRRRHHKSHHKSKHKHKHKSSDASSLAKLRSERLAREQESRQRVQSLIVSERLSAKTVNQTATRR